MPGILRLLPLVGLLVACRAVETTYVYPADLGHPDYVKRAMAVDEFARRADADALPGAFELLRDSDASIRARAWRTIRGLSDGEDFGYRPYLALEVREGIVERWRAWWIKGRGAGSGEDAGE